MFQTAVLASGSKGNAILVRTKSAKILIYVGLSGKQVFAAMEALHLDTQRIDGIILSHEHSDHLRGCGILCRKLKIPLYASYDTYCVAQHKIGKLPVGVQHFKHGCDFTIKDIVIHPFASSHDAVDSSNFTLQNGGEKRLGVITDTGFVTNLLELKTRDCTTLILESNHDDDLLMNGPYPWHLKQRIRGRLGHLSNLQAVGLISKVIHPQLKNLILAHLSEVNNTPEVAAETMRGFLDTIRHNARLIIAGQYKPTEIIDI